MRDTDLLIACLLMLCAALWVGCSDPARTTRREIDRVTRLTQRAEVGLRREARAALLTTATAEGQRRGAELRAAGCGPACATQPSTALIDPCRSVVAASEARYAKRQGEIEAVAKRADAAVLAVYTALVVALDLVVDIEAGVKVAGWQAKLAAVAARLAQTYADALAAVTAAKAAFGGAP